jgi:hypothetical protein
MPESNCLISLGELSKPVTVLIEKISEAVGGIFLPYQIRRVAEADGDASVIRAKAEIEVSDLQRRAMRRFIVEEAQKQENIEAIVQKALPSVSADAPTEHVEKDWIVNFFDKSRLIGDNDMQELWSRVLAGEANSPGSWSKRTINLLASMDKSEAELFRSFCTFVWDIGGLSPLIYDPSDPIYVDAGVHFNSLQHLELMGLIKFEPLAGFARMWGTQQLNDGGALVGYYGQPFKLQFPVVAGDYKFSVGKALLTESGKQLAHISGSSANPVFRDYVLDKWNREGIFHNSAAPDEPPKVD